MPDTAENEAALFRTSVRNITAPVIVLDKSGAIVDGIEAGRFHLYDDNKPQNISVDISVQPLSLVIAIQQSDRVDGSVEPDSQNRPAHSAAGNRR